MQTSYDPQRNVGYVRLAEPGSGRERCVALSASVIACLDAEDSRLFGIELLDTTMFGTPFDDVAAERAVAWVRERLPLHAAS